MVKLKSLVGHRMEDVPDHILYEIAELAKHIVKSSSSELEKHDPNVILAAFSHVLSAMIRHYISDDPKEQRKAAELYAWNVINDVVRPLKGVNDG